MMILGPTMNKEFSPSTCVLFYGTHAKTNTRHPERCTALAPLQKIAWRSLYTDAAKPAHLATTGTFASLSFNLQLDTEEEEEHPLNHSPMNLWYLYLSQAMGASLRATRRRSQQ